MADTHKLPPYRGDLPLVDITRGLPSPDFLNHYLKLWDKVRLLEAITFLTGTGLMVKTGDDTYVVRTITGTTNQVIVTNGTGVSGNPVLSLPQDIDTSANVIFNTATLNTLHILSSGAAFDIIWTVTEAITADRTITIIVNNADRTLHIEGNATIDQDYSVDGNVQFATLTLNNSGLHLLDTDATHDLIIAPGSNLTADRILTVTTGDSGRDLAMEGNAIISQDYSVDGTVQFATLTLNNAGLHLLDTNGSHDLIVTPGSDLTSDHSFTITTGDADRTVTVNGNPTLNDWFDQSVKAAATPTHAGLTLTGFAGVVHATAGVISASTESALTEQLTTVTCSNPGTPDYAIADPTVTTPYGFTTADEFLSVVKVIANLQTRVGELEDKLQALGVLA